MATLLIRAGAASGAMSAVLAGRYISDVLAADYAADATIAETIAVAVAAQAATVTLADADLATPNMEILCASVTNAVLQGRDIRQLSGESAAIDAVALSICAAVKAGIAAFS